MKDQPLLEMTLQEAIAREMHKVTNKHVEEAKKLGRREKETCPKCQDERNIEHHVGCHKYEFV